MASWRSHAWVGTVIISPLMFAALYWTIKGRPSLTFNLIFPLVYFGLCKSIIWNHFFSPLNAVPEAPGDRFALGHGFDVLSEDYPASALEWASKIEGHRGMIRARDFFLTTDHIVVASGQVLADVISRRAYDYIKPEYASQFLEKLLGKGLVVSEGNEHKSQRKLVQPSFTGKTIKDLAPVFWAKSQELCDILDRDLVVKAKEDTPGLINLETYASRATLDIIGTACLGRDFGTLGRGDDKGGDELVQLYTAVTDPNDMGILAIFISLMFVPGWLAWRLPLRASGTIAHASKRLREICIQLLATKRAAIESGTDKDNRSILALLLQSTSMDDQQIVNQLLTFLAAGHETTASALEWTMLELARHPEAQTRARQEALSALKPEMTRAGAPLPDDLAGAIEGMPYLNAVASETLRYWPTVPVTPRVAAKDTLVLDQLVPKGTLVDIMPLTINRLEELWGPEAGAWNPDRWIKDEQRGGATSPYAFMTFLHGPRSCIGQGFAKLELRCLLAALLLRFKWELADPDEKIVPGGIITIKPSHGLKLKMTALG